MTKLASLNDQGEEVDTGNDSIVIINYIEGVPGGYSLDTTGFTPKVIQAGHIVIKSAEGVCKPMPIAEGGKAYAALPAGHTIDSVVVASKLTSLPMVGVMVRGSVNQVASPYPVTDAIRKALPLIRFTQD